MDVDMFTTVLEARKWIDENAPNPGCDCPCCGAPNTIYPRNINAAAISDLTMLYRHTQRAGPGYYHYRTFLHGSERHGDFAKFEKLGLIDRAINTSTKKRTSGTYAITETGVMFVEGQLQIPSKMVIYKNVLIDTVGPMKDIKGMWPDFDFASLMAGDG